MKNKRIAKDLIRAYFGKGAKIGGFGGHYRITTPTGAEVLIKSNKIDLVVGGDDVYRACTLLSRELWGKPDGARKPRIHARNCGAWRGEQRQCPRRSFKSIRTVLGARSVFVCVVIVG